MSDERRTILQRVASGELTPEEAADLLDHVAPPAPPTPPSPTPAPTAPESGEAPPFEPLQEAPQGEPVTPPPPPNPNTLTPGGLRTVRVVRNLGNARILGDREVREAVAEGPHRAEQQGDELVIHSDFDEQGGFSFDRIEGQWGRYRNARLNVRMNPALALVVETQGSQVQVEGVTGPIRGEVQAGLLNVQGAEGPLDLQVQAGSLTVSGVLRQGSSKLRCEAGSIRVVLKPGSSVRIVAHATMGHLSLPGQGLGQSDEVVVGGGTREVTIGNGEALLEVESTMGSVRITQE